MGLNIQLVGEKLQLLKQ